VVSSGRVIGVVLGVCAVGVDVRAMSTLGHADLRPHPLRGGCALTPMVRPEYAAVKRFSRHPRGGAMFTPEGDETHP
jgi:hypothetical protein